MPKKRRSREKEYTLFRCAATSVAATVFLYMAIASIMAVMVNMGKLKVEYAHYAAAAAAGVSCFAAVAVTGKKKKEKSVVVALITAAAAICFLLILPLTDSRGAEGNLGWHSMACSAAGCLMAVPFTKRIKRKKRK